jgi:hypothetical protein
MFSRQQGATQGASQNASQYAAQGLSPRSGKPIIVYKYNNQVDLKSMTPEEILAIDINDVPGNIDERFPRSPNLPLSDKQLAAVESLAAKKYQARPYNSGGGARKRRRKTRKIRRKNNKK